MTETLKPCPLCGSTDVLCYAEYDGDSYDNEPVYRVVVGCLGCREEDCDSDYDEEPCFGIEAYFRGDHPLIRDLEDPEDCERILEHHMAERWNRRAERTCHNADVASNSLTCSECGEITSETLYWVDIDHECRTVMGKKPRFCSNCGAKVVG